MADERKAPPDVERMPLEELQKHEAVLQLGHMLGVTLMDRIKEQVMAMDEQQRVVFYSAMLKAPVGCMRASIGTEATMAILDSAKEYLRHG
jgi:hypothetical protein